MKRNLLLIMTMLAAVITIISFQQTQSKTAAVAYSFPVQFLPTPPKELQPGASPEQLATFAWDEFLALNWRSAYRVAGKRDHPDLSWTYSNNKDPFPDLVIWETYAHRTELRPASDNMGPFDKVPNYSFINTPPPIPGASVTLFDNLDENNEIGSCDVYAHVNTYGRKYMVLYQAKANRDEYEYLLNNYPTKARLLAATTNNANNITTDSAYYPGATSTCNCPPDKNVLCLPCGGAPVPGKPGQTYTGAMEVKTAWRPLTPLDDPSRYFTRKVIVYANVKGATVATNQTYALIGLHIIHKTANYPNFVFATFEQVDVEKSNMGFVYLDDNNQETGPIHPQYPRLHPIAAVTDSSTAYVHRELKKRNPNSIWQYYRLVGVQGNPTNNTSSFSFFLANYVIESDSTLANFRGSGIGTPYNGLTNSLYKGHGYSMGGCQGCHGVAQTKLGGDCSFLMDTIGKPVPTPDIGLTTGKLQRYINALQHINEVQQARLKK